MCRRVECPICGKPTWAGCGAHVEQVLGGVPKAERCQGHDEDEESESMPPAGPPGRRSWISRLFGT